MLLDTSAAGVFPIAPTPFLDDGRIDGASIDRLTDFYVGIGATGITVLGQLGEAPKLEHAESVDVAARIKTLKVSDPPKRGAGVKVPDVATLVAKLKNEAKVI